MIGYKAMSHVAVTWLGGTGDRWRASAVRVSIPTPDAAESMCRSAWCRPDRHGVWPATMNLAQMGSRVI